MIIVTRMLYEEECYLREFIDFHREQGFKTFYVYVIYGNLHFGKKISLDRLLFTKLVEQYKDIKFIHLYTAQQPSVHITHFINYFKNIHLGKWCAILDIDEFLSSPITGKKVTDFIDFYDSRSIDSVYVNWLCYGSNGIITNPTRKVLNIFTKPTNKYNGINFVGKSFIKINKSLSAKNVSSHQLGGRTYYTSTGIRLPVQNSKYKEEYLKSRTKYMQYNPTAGLYGRIYVYPEETPNLIIRHYITKSKEEYENKMKRNPNAKKRYSWTHFNYLK